MKSLQGEVVTLLQPLIIFIYFCIEIFLTKFLFWDLALKHHEESRFLAAGSASRPADHGQQRAQLEEKEVGGSDEGDFREHFVKNMMRSKFLRLSALFLLVSWWSKGRSEFDK